jgi:MFS family permease
MNLSVDRAGEDAGGGLGGNWRPRWLSRDLLCLFAARALRSFAIGYIAIILPIYITELGYNPVHLGMLFSISGFTSAVLAISIGVLADRFGRKPFIILIALMMAAGSVVLPLAHNFAVIVAAAAFGTIGFPGGAGGGGGWGPYYPAAQSLVAEQAEYEHRTTIFSVLSFVGVIAGSLGSLASALPRLLSTTAKVPMLTGFRLLLLLTAPIGILMALVVIPVREIRYPRMLGQAPDPDSQMSRAAVNVEIIEVRKRFGLSPKSWRLVWRFMVTNTINGIAMGMMGPFVVYWFYKRFGVSAADLGHLYFIINICAALPYLAVGRVARRFGAVVTITVSRGISAIMLIVVILMPTYSLAATVYVLRVLVAVFAVPVRQSFLMGVIDPAERSSAAGFAATPSQVSQSISAYAAGILIHYVALSMPLMGAGVFQGLNALLYFSFFRNVRPPEELNVLPAADEQEQIAQTVTDAKARR